jgi:perosamine synthetase
MNERIYYTKPSITELEVSFATDAARNGWGERCYEYIGRFEEGFKAHLGVEHAIATSSCTGALHMGMAALGIGPTDEVIMADTNWIATAAPVVHLGAKPVFVDILEDSWCIDPDKAEAAITAKTKAIIAVHLYGNLCDMDRLVAIGQQHRVAIIEDAAEALGSIWRGQRAGSMGKFGTFSFHGSKTVTTGEGGMFVTQDPGLYETVLTLSNHGRARGQTKHFWPEMLGFKYKMSNIQAALGCAQMQRIEKLLEDKRYIFNGYQQRLAGYPVTLNPEPAGTVNGYWMPTVVFDRATGVRHDAIETAFRRANIDARTFFHPLSSLGLFDGKPDTPTAFDVARRAFNLPSYSEMDDSAIDRVCGVISSLLKPPAM